jgi:hypothetical protein
VYGVVPIVLVVVLFLVIEKADYIGSAVRWGVEDEYEFLAGCEIFVTGF